MAIDRIIRVDMTTGDVTEERAPEAYALLGGRALTSRMLLEETDARIHPLSEAAKLLIAPGLLAGTAVTTSGRTSFGFKSPLTGGTKEANVGGNWGTGWRGSESRRSSSREHPQTAGSASTSTGRARVSRARTTSRGAATTTFTASW